MNYQKIAPVIRQFLEHKGLNSKCRIALAGTAGSQRLYYRLEQNQVRYILMVSPRHDSDFGRFLRLTQFYRLLQFPVPRVFCIADAEMQVLLEDLGNHTLHTLVLSKTADVIGTYKKVIDTLLYLQDKCYRSYNECPDIFSRLFHMPDLLWETNYFKTEYLLGHCQRTFSDDHSKHIDNIFQTLAHTVAGQPKTIMHRDFQSQNIMIQNQTIRIIDYQGSRLGSVYYDIASLLLDPYTQLSADEIQILFAYFHSHVITDVSLESAYQSMLLAGSQRIMQALGAFCFLSHKKGISKFAAFITPGEERLKWVLNEAGLVDLWKLVQRPSGSDSTRSNQSL